LFKRVVNQTGSKKKAAIHVIVYLGIGDMEIRSSTNYIWNIKDVLGQGATGAVYKGRHKVNYRLLS